MEKMLRELKKYYRARKRDLPWRKIRDPYKILVSEIMLQQTQVSRAVPFYLKFIRKFPTTKILANAKLSDVLKLWSGLGYNRRAKFLHEAAKKIIGEYGGIFPRRPDEIEKLPGVGHYTARAVIAFTYNKPEIFVETNIRTVFLHHGFLQKAKIVSDKEILPLVAEALKKSKMQPRDFYAALMDYGSFLKRSGVRLNSKSVYYTKQKKFEGSTRQLRGALLRELLRGPATLPQLSKKVSRTKGEAARVLARLVGEGLVGLKGGQYSIQA